MATRPPCIAYLFGERFSPIVRGFEVLEQLRLDERWLWQALSVLDYGALEILVSRCSGRP